ncbi:uncharacterized protein TNCV_3160031 [Trichonephila clavipes]|nr:uncharacterized protein TNCV_3160031 [Trichonephila clavipes]
MVELKKLPGSPDIFQLETCCYLTIKIDSFNRRPGATQCYNCNLFHHSSSNCNIKTRYLKCGEPHKTGDCPIKTKIENPTCIIASRKDTWLTRTAVRNSRNLNQEREKPPKIETTETKMIAKMQIVIFLVLLPLCRSFLRKSCQKRQADGATPRQVRAGPIETRSNPQPPLKKIEIAIIQRLSSPKTSVLWTQS